MHSFPDNAGRTWTVAINVAAVKRVRGLVNIDLYKLVDDGFRPLGELVADPVQLADVLYCLCISVTPNSPARQIDGNRSSFREVLKRIVVAELAHEPPADIDPFTIIDLLADRTCGRDRTPAGNPDGDFQIVFNRLPGLKLDTKRFLGRRVPPIHQFHAFRLEWFTHDHSNLTGVFALVATSHSAKQEHHCGQHPNSV